MDACREALTKNGIWLAQYPCRWKPGTSSYANSAPGKPFFPEAQAEFAQSRTDSAEVNPLCAGMPRLNGISYSLIKAYDGKACVVASGATGSKRQILSQAGFRYNAQRKIWWHYAEVAEVLQNIQMMKSPFRIGGAGLCFWSNLYDGGTCLCCPT